MQTKRLITVATVAVAMLFAGAVSALADAPSEHPTSGDTPWDLNEDTPWDLGGNTPWDYADTPWD
ncbi:hypothetical protein [Nonomuraea jiangxiensis]|uniref:Uncharacterized protein n=1 Tax=Nonomuraea jiangxiensis TaxID=633440 RepID=A0A1G9QVE5_9ACTN|nr:hypothetical protein [Nonomuraea jiangxiensis]SDM14986.1 hypothetical protein SAMN05421869_13725 [Nonomuraea jiangxiensis]